MDLRVTPQLRSAVVLRGYEGGARSCPRLYPFRAASRLRLRETEARRSPLTQNPSVARIEQRRLAMKRAITMTCLTLLVTLLVALGTTVDAGSSASPPHSSAYGKPLPEWMQLYITWLFNGGSGNVGPVTFLPIPSGNVIGGTFTFDDPATVQGHLDVTLAPGTPFVLSVVGWFGE